MLADKDERARRLRQAIKDRGFASFKEAARRHHYTESTLTHHANGTRAFDLETGYDYAKALKVDPAWLLGLTAAPHAASPVTTQVLRDMLEAAMRELPVGATVEDYLRIVPKALHERIERFLIDEPLRGIQVYGSDPGKDVQPLQTTK